MEKVFDLQFWVIILIFAPVIWFGGKKLKEILVLTVIKSVAEVVKDQWAQMFLKLDEYKGTVATHGIDIEELKKVCQELSRTKMDKAEIDDIIRKIQGIK